MNGCRPTAASPTPPNAERLNGAEHLPRLAVPCIAVACSGGRDSTALLHATLRAAVPLGITVVALHVHHGLLPEADAWLASFEARCQRWAKAGWPLAWSSTRITSHPAPGDSLEAWARQQRYQALHRMAIEAGCNAVLLAHHRRDQAETFLLQALRGAGMAGLAAMPARRDEAGVQWLRPWLRQPREAIEGYVRRHRLAAVDDPSNADPRLARSRLREQVWPALQQAFPQAETCLADAAAWAADARQALDELAALDLAPVVANGRLRLGPWQALSPSRRANALRAWLLQAAGRAAPASLVRRLMDALSDKGADAAGGRRWPMGDGFVCEQRGALLYRQATAKGDAPQEPMPLAIRRAGRYPVPAWGGLLVVRRVREGGVPLAWMAQAELRPRGGGERFQAGLGRPPRSLKRQFQAAGLAAWQRTGPLLYSGGQLVFVPGLGLDARVIGLPGQALVLLDWQPLPGAGEAAAP